MKSEPALPAQRQAIARSAARSAGRPPRSAKADADKPRFDFYKILPGVEEPKVAGRGERRRADRAVVDQAKARRSTSAAEGADKAADKGDETVAAAEPTEAAAKAAGALLAAGGLVLRRRRTPRTCKRAARARRLGGSIQQGALPDKSVRYRVRLGPYDNTDELNRMKSELASAASTSRSSSY